MSAWWPPIDSMRGKLAALILCAFGGATAAEAQITLSPSSLSRGEEAFVQVALAVLTSTDTAIVIYSGPEGISTVEPQLVGEGYLVAWVPQAAMNTPGTYAVDVDVTRNGVTTRYGPAQMVVRDLPLAPALMLKLPEVVTAEATSSAGATVTFSASASDGTAVGCSPGSGALFPLGTTAVNCTAGAASASFVVVVHDTVRPVLSLPADIVTSRTVVQYSATVTDIIDPAPVIECTPGSGSTFSLGTTNVQCNGIDHHQNDAQGTFKVTVTNGAPVTITNLQIANPYFSPNSDGSKDTTTVTAGASSADTAWTVKINAASGATILTTTQSGTSLSYLWNGRDANGVLQPDGSYTFAIDAVDGIYSASAAVTTVVDLTVPAATLSSPASGQTYSNIRQNGGTSITATGSVSDTNLSDWDIGHTGADGQLALFGTGMTSVSNGQLGVWSSAGASNGSYTVRLTARDKAGNKSVATAVVTVAHFSVTQNVHQANAAAGEHVTYTSIVPFPLTETLTIRNAAGAIVRTLANGTRAAGTYADQWDGRNDAGTLLPDGDYRYLAIATEGTSSMTWDLSGQMRGASATQLPYPSCSGRSMPLGSCESHALAKRQYDPYANDPLKIHYSVAEPSRVSVVLSTVAETPATCDGTTLCVVDGEYRPTGQHVETWAGVLGTGLYDPAARPFVTVIRRTDTFPKNVVVLYGAGPAVRVKALTVTPPLYSPEAGTMTIEFDLEAVGGTPVTVEMKIVRQAEGVYSASTLRTVTLTNQPAGRISHVWDGRASSGHWVGDGEYGLVVTASTGGLSSTSATRFVVIY